MKKYLITYHEYICDFSSQNCDAWSHSIWKCITVVHRLSSVICDFSAHKFIVTLANSVPRNKVLFAARKLVSSSNFSKVYLNPDLTKKERDDEKAKRIERNAKNEEAIRQNLPFRYILKRGKVTQIPVEEYRAPGNH